MKKSLQDKLKDFRKRAALVLLSGILTINMFGCKNNEHIHNDDQSNDTSIDTLDPDFTPDTSEFDNNFTFEPIPSDIPDVEDVTIIQNDNLDNEENITNDTIIKNDGTVVKDDDIVEDLGTTPAITPSIDPDIKDEEDEKHVHQFGEWNVLDNEQEIRKCECGESERQEHYFNVLNNYIYNYDNIYQQVTEYACVNCGYTKTEAIAIEDIEFTDWVYNPEFDCDERTSTNYDYKESRLHEHEIEFSSYDEDYEYYKCDKCGYEYKVNHKLDDGTLNKNGSTIYDCLNDGCDYQKEVKPSHSHTGGSSHSKPSHTHSFEFQSNNNEDGEIWICQEDGETVVRNHNLDSGVVAGDITTYTCLTPGCGYTKTVQKEHVHDSIFKENRGDLGEAWGCSQDEYIEDELRNHNKATTFTYDPLTGNEVFECTTDGCDYTFNDRHTIHDWQLTKADKSGETWTCSICEITSERSHNLPAKGTPVEDGLEYKCQNDGCTYSYVENHIHHMDEEVSYVRSETECKRYRNYCTECGYEEYNYTTEHTFKTYGTRTICSECGYVKTQSNSIVESISLDHEHSHSHILNKDDDSKDELTNLDIYNVYVQSNKEANMSLKRIKR